MSADFERSSLSRVVAVTNGKGGVGKTSITANIGGLLALSGWKVLIVDLDNQGNLGLDFGYKNSDIDDEGRELSKAIVATQDPTENRPTSPAKEIRPGLDVLVGGPAIDRAVVMLQFEQMQGGDKTDAAQLAVATMLDPIADDYDIILLDCPPNNETLQVLGVAAARYALIPTKTDAGSVGGLDITAGRMQKVFGINPDIDVLGLVVFDSGTTSTRVREEAKAELVESLGGETEVGELIFDAFIRHAESTARSCRKKGLLAHELDQLVRGAEPFWKLLRQGKKAVSAGPVSSRSVADDYQALALEIRDRILKIEEHENIGA